MKVEFKEKFPNRKKKRNERKFLLFSKEIKILTREILSYDNIKQTFQEILFILDHATIFVKKIKSVSNLKLINVTIS